MSKVLLLAFMLACAMADNQNVASANTEPDMMATNTGSSKESGPSMEPAMNSGATMTSTMGSGASMEPAMTPTTGAAAKDDDTNVVVSTTNGASIEVESEMSYEELMAFSDQIWYDVEHGIMNPRQANKKFETEVGVSVMDFMSQGGELLFN